MLRPKSFLNFMTNASNSKDFEPWKEKKFGRIPNATTSRAIYMNKLLPDFYKCCFKVSLNAKDFIVRFHAEGKRQYNAEQTFIELRDTFDNSIRNVKDLSSTANIMILNILLDYLTLAPLSTTRTGSNNCTRKERNWKKNLLNAVIYLLTSQVRSNLAKILESTLIAQCLAKLFS